MKKILTFIIVAAIVAALAVCPTQAAEQKYEFMLALGDSITTGYGLDGEAPYDCESYANLVAQSLGLEAKSSYVNRAVDGATSKDLLKLLPELENYLGYSDLIVVTIGGNDLLQSVSIIASAVAGKSVTGLSASIDVLSAAGPEKFAALSSNTSFQTKMGAVLTSYATNLAASAKIIKENAPTARVIFLKQYNPLKNVPGFETFGDFADTLFMSINSSIDTVCEAYGFEALDVPSVIDVNAAALTNMLNYDIHPNADGHKAIGDLLTEHLNTVAFTPETEPATEPVTEPETEPVTEPVTEAEATTEPETEAQLEASGCGSVISSAAIILAAVGAFVALKKKEN